MVSTAVDQAAALVKRVTLPSTTMKHQNYETLNQRKYETTKVPNRESTKQRKYETTKVRNNESGKKRKSEITEKRKGDANNKRAMRNSETAKQRKGDAKQQYSGSARWPYSYTIDNRLHVIIHKIPTVVF